MVNYDIPWTRSRFGDRTNERTNVAHHCTISIRVLPLSCIPRCQPDRATIVPHGSFFPRMKLILRDVGARNALPPDTFVQDGFSGYTPRHFRSLSLSISPLFPKVIRNGHEKDVKGWLLSVAIVVSVISRLYLEPRLK